MPREIRCVECGKYLGKISGKISKKLKPLCASCHETLKIAKMMVDNADKGDFLGEALKDLGIKI